MTPLVLTAFAKPRRREPSRIFESPYTDDFQPADTLVPETEVEGIATSVRVIRVNTDPEQKRA
ncbi:Uncharacterised protein [Mycobacteroides abscessus subsp. abscessus]|nr:Uncharacterised protein [Mycobacteroides abscessus subsp. abscessus]